MDISRFSGMAFVSLYTMKLTKIEYALGKERIGSYVMHHPVLGVALRSQAAALILEVLLCWDGSQHDPEGWIYKSNIELTAETGLSERQQRPAIKILLDLGLIKKKVSGIPPTNGFLLQKVRIQEWWFGQCDTNKLSQMNQTESENHDVQEVQNNLYTSSTHDATGIPTPTVGVKNSGQEKLEWSGSFKIKKAWAETLEASRIRKAEEEANQNLEIDQVIQAVKEQMDLPMLDKTLAENRRVTKLALEKFGLESIRAILTIASQDEFWKSRVTSVSDVYNNGLKILSSKRFLPRGAIQSL